MAALHSLGRRPLVFAAGVGGTVILAGRTGIRKIGLP
jgi:hypothetical protein